jgi:hypothetical protein
MLQGWFALRDIVSAAAGRREMVSVLTPAVKTDLTGTAQLLQSHTAADCRLSMQYKSHPCERVSAWCLEGVRVCGAAVRGNGTFQLTGQCVDACGQH